MTKTGTIIQNGRRKKGEKTLKGVRNIIEKNKVDAGEWIKSKNLNERMILEYSCRRKLKRKN